MKHKILPGLVFICMVTIAQGQPGQLDLTFGINGIIKADLGSPFNYSRAGITVLAKPDGSLYPVFADNGTIVVGKIRKNGSLDFSYGKKGLSVPINMNFFGAAFQQDGKIVVVGYKQQNTYEPSLDLEVARLDVNGSLDNTFSGKGKLFKHEFSQLLQPRVFKIQDDGKILIGYTAGAFGSNVTLLLQRYNENGSIDSSFNKSGSVPLDNDFTNFSSISIQNDGKIILAGTSIYNGNSHILDLKRLNYNGTTDSTFNGTGETLTDIGFPVGVTSSSIQRDGKLIVAGYADSAGQRDFLLARYNTNGTLDSSTFGEKGKQTTAFAGRNSVATCIAIQKNGKIILSGYSGITNNDFAQARYNSDGRLDSTFNVDGTRITDFDSGDDKSNAIVIQKDGKVLILGVTKNAGESYQELAVSRYNRHGSPDHSFGGDGKLIIRSATIRLQGDTRFNSSAVQRDGKLVVAGYTWNGINYDFAIARYNIDGTADRSFSRNGQQFTDFNSSSDSAYAVAIQDDGKIIVAGATGDHLALAWFDKNGRLIRKETSDVFPRATSIAIQKDGKVLVNCHAFLLRYNADGLPDLTFGANGKLDTRFSPSDPFSCNALALQNDGKIVVTTGKEPFAPFIVARFNTNGSLDNTFGVNGSTSYGNFDENYPFSYHYIAVGTAVTISNDGKIIVAGTLGAWYRSKAHNIFTMRINADGSVDKVFEEIISPNATDDVIPQNFATSVSIQPDDKVITGGYSYDGSTYNFTLSRYNTDGSLDHTFNNTGVSTIPVSTGDNKIAATILSNDKLYAVGFGQYPANFGVVARYNLGCRHNPETSARGMQKVNIDGGFKVTATPNPSQNYFSIMVNSNSTDPITLTLTDVSGRLIERKSNVTAGIGVLIGNKVPAGLYIVEVRQGIRNVVLKLVKQ